MGEIGTYIEQGVVPIPTDHRKYIRAITFASDGNRIITCSDDLRISVIDLHEQKTLQTFSGHLNLINCVDSHPNDPVFVTASNDKTVKVWDMRSSQSVDSINSNSNMPLWSVKYGNKGREILIGAENGILTLMSS